MSVITDLAGVVGGREPVEPGRSDAISSYAILHTEEWVCNRVGPRGVTVDINGRGERIYCRLNMPERTFYAGTSLIVCHRWTWTREPECVAPADNA